MMIRVNFLSKDNKSLYILILTIILMTPVVFGATGVFDKALEPLKDLPEVYQNNAVVIDAILYFVLFIAVAKSAFGEKFKDSNVPTVMGVILAISMITFEYTSKFRLGKWLIPVAIIAGILYIIKKVRTI